MLLFGTPVGQNALNYEAARLREEYNAKTRRRIRTALNLLSCTTKSAEAYLVTLVTQMSPERLPTFAVVAAN